MSMNLTDTPTGGKAEVLEALRIERQRLTSEGGVDYHRLVRHFPTRTDTFSDFDAILSTLGGLSYVVSDGSGGFKITAAGQTYLRAHRPRRSAITVI